MRKLTAVLIISAFMLLTACNKESSKVDTSKTVGTLSQEEVKYSNAIAEAFHKKDESDSEPTKVTVKKVSKLKKVVRISDMDRSAETAYGSSIAAAFRNRN